MCCSWVSWQFKSSCSILFSFHCQGWKTACFIFICKTLTNKPPSVSRTSTPASFTINFSSLCFLWKRVRNILAKTISVWRRFWYNEIPNNCLSLQNIVCKLLSLFPLSTHRSTCCNETFDLALAGLKSMCHEVAACSVLQQLQSECVCCCISSHKLHRTNNRINSLQPHCETEGKLLTFSQPLYYIPTTVLTVCKWLTFYH